MVPIEAAAPLPPFRRQAKGRVGEGCFCRDATTGQATRNPSLPLPVALRTGQKQAAQGGISAGDSAVIPAHAPRVPRTTAGEGRSLIGLGVDEDAAVAVEGDGRARVCATQPRAGAAVVRGGLPRRQVAGRPLALERVELVGVGTGSILYLPSGRVEAPMFERVATVRDGRLSVVEVAGGR